MNEIEPTGHLDADQAEALNEKIKNALDGVDPSEYPLPVDHPATKVLAEARLRQKGVSQEDFEIAMAALDHGDPEPAQRLLGIEPRAPRHVTRAKTGSSKSVRRKRSEKKRKRVQSKKSKRKNR